MTCPPSLESNLSWCQETYQPLEPTEVIMQNIKAALPFIEGVLDKQSCSGWLPRIKILPQKSCFLCSRLFRRFFADRCACYQGAYLKPEEIDLMLPTLENEFGAVVLGLALQQAQKENIRHTDLSSFVWYLIKLCFHHRERMCFLTRACYQLAESCQEMDWFSVEEEALYILSVCSGYEAGEDLLNKCSILAERLLTPNTFGCRGYLQGANWCSLDFRKPLDQKTLVGAINLIHSYFPKET